MGKVIAEVLEGVEKWPKSYRVQFSKACRLMERNIDIPHCFNCRKRGLTSVIGIFKDGFYEDEKYYIVGRLGCKKCGEKVYTGIDFIGFDDYQKHANFIYDELFHLWDIKGKE